MRSVILWCAVGLMFFAFSACKQGKSPEKAVEQTKEVVENKYAKNFEIFESNGLKYLYILNPQNNDDTIKYVLTYDDKEGASFEDHHVITLPLQSIVPLSSTNIGALKLLNEEKKISAVSEIEYVYDSSLQARFAQGDLKEVGQSQSLNFEKVIQLNPDLVIAIGYSGVSLSKFDKLSDFGIPVLLSTNWQESTPLARAEWIKVYGLLLDKFDESIGIFNGIESRYQEIKSHDAIKGEPEEVLVNIPFKGTWYMPNGGSYMAHFMRDAHMQTPWMHTKGTGSLALNFEEVYPFGLKTQKWINVSYENSIEGIVGLDNRFKDFASIKNGQVYNNNNKVNQAGANDYWESGPYYPDVILQDLMKIAFPKAMESHEFYYYKKLQK
ncbi:iron ABC transporter substrate-binding protein [Aureibacter tunicatorum]|nr:iron ABC transporter substrate-binding protein [Aureibacter tunicatorum]